MEWDRDGIGVEAFILSKKCSREIQKWIDSAG